MRIAITGGTGFVGTHITRHFVHQGHEVYILTRNPDKHPNTDKVKYVGWLKDEFSPEQELPPLDGIVNLAGENLNSSRWTEETKKRIMNSRIEATEAVLDLIKKMEHPPGVLVNASAVGFYGTSKSETFTEETTTPGDDFLANVVTEWEKRAEQATNHNVRTVYLRFGVILGEEGALPKMALPYKMMAGGPVGDGEQWMSWIHIQDIVGMVDFALNNDQVKGPMNATAPEPKRNKELGHTIGKVLNRPHWLPVPSIALKGALGEMSILLLQGQYVYPQKALEQGYEFQYPTLEPALRDILCD
ncbi:MULTISPECIES: TIGR01777 family oxidoreductase [Pontibacillus]|uniref:TIGR01777 family oxidoreductase n=1 Tax=Pontibacillus chungwhensis TaxID=265426 RepID=A0ABY8V0Z8_9BACI|nr:MULTISPECIES: TIGR01777 family oxidoreductase [Pontibacillus]MCD5325547.1 TIGR01777 family oxidoreductase [Pontibacillus sp. HN14]WIF98656.1 TIGR01777 family oxidoreductase [Pontibacillus chungwhensis]